MPLKGKIKDDHMPVNAPELRVPGVPPLTLVNADEIEETLQTVDLPDRTVASGGQREPLEFNIMIPMHHSEEITAMELWYKQGQDPVLPGYKRTGTYIWPSLTGQTRRSFMLLGLFVAGRTIPAKDMTNEGELALATYRMRASDIELIN